MDEEYIKKVGTQHGMGHALMRLKFAIGRERHVLEFMPSRYTRKRRPHELKMSALQEAYDTIETDLRRLQAAT